ncbi:uncharacterized protein DC041_0000730 [Schistosoma bovis]|uniref:Uncharacterized protein n=1 Tax=Schistosoma bovis TaxID=6184 RepID=A0A430QMW0_SCHBO|nr:uncharacterized protein DC041_0000730 [Schistosoma bovis]
MVPYIMGYVQTAIDPYISNQASIWLSAIALAVQGISMPVGGIIADKLGFRVVVAVSCLTMRYTVLFYIDRRFTDPDVLDRLPSAFLILGGILLFIQVIGFGLLRPKPTSKRLFGQTFISDDRFLSAVATASSLFNCAGRIIWGEIVDRVSFKTVGSVLCATVTTLVSYQNAYIVQFTGCGFVCLFAFFLALWIKDQKMPEKVNRCQLCTDTCRSLRIPQPISVTAEELERLNQANPSN